MALGRKKKQPVRRPGAQAERPGVFSYYAQARSDNVQNTGRVEEQITNRAPSRLRYIPTIIASTLIIGAGLYSLWLKPSPKIVVLGQPNTIFQSAETYQSGIADIWRSSLSNQSKLTLNSAKLTQDIKQKFPEIAEVKIELPLLGQRASVVLVPAQPTMQLLGSQGSFYLNAQGKALAESGTVRNQELKPQPTVQDATDTDISVGTAVLPEAQVRFLTGLYATLRAAKLPIESMILPSTAANQVDVRLEGKGYYLKFNLLTDPKQAVGSYLASKEKTAAKEYIDLRVPEKVFYK